MAIQMKLHRGFCIICNKFLPFKQEHWHPRGTLASTMGVTSGDGIFHVSFVPTRIICKNTLVFADKRSKVTRFVDDVRDWIESKISEFETGE